MKEINGLSVSGTDGVVSWTGPLTLSSTLGVVDLTKRPLASRVRRELGFLGLGIVEGIH